MDELAFQARPERLGDGIVEACGDSPQVRHPERSPPRFVRSRAQRDSCSNIAARISDWSRSRQSLAPGYGEPGRLSRRSEEPVVVGDTNQRSIDGFS